MHKPQKVLGWLLYTGLETEKHTLFIVICIKYVCYGFEIPQTICFG